MGRSGNACVDPDGNTKFYLKRVELNSGGYDSGGAYWGVGQPLFWALQANCEEGQPEELFFRAADREAAKAHIRRLNPNAAFFR